MATIIYKNITKAQFDEFLEALRLADEKEYVAEGKDGFVDLYNYWDAIIDERGGLRRFNEKILKNKAKVLLDNQ